MKLLVLVERECQKQERSIDKAAASTSSEPLGDAEIGTSDSVQWLYPMTKREANRNADFLIDSGAATSVCQQSLAVSFGGKPNGLGMELRAATGHQFTAAGNTTICLHTRDGINVSGDFQIAPRISGLQRSIISDGQVCD